MPAEERAVCVCFDGDRVLVMRRRRAGRAYTVLPGGGIERGEAPREAAVRELREETGFDGVVLRQLAVIDHDDRRASYFLVRVSGGHPVLGGPEAAAQGADDTYTPTWIEMQAFDDEPLVPREARAVVLAGRRRAELDGEVFPARRPLPE